MIIKKRLLDTVDPVVAAGVNALHFAIGSTMDIQMLAGLTEPPVWKSLKYQGGNIEKVNKARADVGLFELSTTHNVKIVEPGWGKQLQDGTGALVAVTTPGGSVRYGLNKNVLDAIGWVLENTPGVEIDTMVNESFATIFIHKPETKHVESGTTYELINPETPESITEENQ